MVRGGAGRWVIGVIVAVSFGTGKLEHEGLECRINGFCHRFFGRGFEAVLEGFKMGFDVVNVIGGCLSSHGQGLGGVFKACDPCELIRFTSLK